MSNKEEKKKDPLTVVSHHVRNPIFVLKGYLEALLVGDIGEMNEKQKEYVKACIDNADQLTDIVKNLINVMEIDDGKYEIAKKPVDLEKVIKNSVEENFFLAKAANANIQFEEKEGDFTVLTDPVKIGMVLENFITNAITYKKEGEGKIVIELERRNGEILCSVKDNGIGVPEGEEERIFSKFYRTERAMRIKPDSLGLELYINKSVIELSGGKVWCESNDEGGTTFFFTLPADK